MIGVTILICMLTTLLVYIYWKQKFSKFAKQINKFPGPFCLPIIGSIYRFYNLSREQMFLTLRNLSKQYSGTYNIWSLHHGMLNIFTAEDSEILLSSTNHIEKSFFYDFISAWLGRGLLTSTDQKWQHRRKLLTPSFHFNILQRFVEIFGEHSQQLVEDLEKECAKSQSNIVPIISKSTLQVICETAMGTTLDLQNKSEKTYFQSIYKIADLMIQRTISPWLYNSFIFNLTPLGWKHNKTINLLHTFTKNVIKERETNFKDSDLNINNNAIDDGVYKKKKLAMLDLLIQAKHMQQVDDEGIREEVDTFMFEGHDTTSTSLTFSLMLLANHEECQNKIREELDEIFGKSNRPATYEDLQNMQYLELCIKESLRLYPSVPHISRIIREELVLSEHSVPAGCVINLHIFDLHRDPKYFPDPEKFDPDRFLPENSKGRHPYAYVPFSAGPRNCIGQKFAMLEMKSILSAVLRNYILIPVTDSTKCSFQMDLVLRSNKDIYVKFKSRNK